MKLGTMVVVDDEPHLCELYTLMFTQEGFDVYTAPDGLQGVMKINEVKPDIVLLDFNMPEMDGDEVIEAIRDSVQIEVPIVVISGTTNNENITRAKELGIREFIAKAEYDNEELVSKIMSIYELYRQEKIEAVVQ